MGLPPEALGKGNVKIRGMQPGICTVSPALHSCLHVAFAALTLFRVTSRLYEGTCRPAAPLSAQQRTLASGLAHCRALGVLPVQGGEGKDPGVG